MLKGLVLETQTIFHQPRFPRLANQFLKHLLETFFPDAIAKLGATGVMRQFPF
jgi:hypothetical protein